MLDYDSDSSDGGSTTPADAFQIASLTSAKKPRIDGPSTSKATISAAPDVLSEVSLHDLFRVEDRVLNAAMYRIL